MHLGERLARAAQRAVALVELAPRHRLGGRRGVGERVRLQLGLRRQPRQRRLGLELGGALELVESPVRVEDRADLDPVARGGADDVCEHLSRLGSRRLYGQTQMN